MELIKIIDLIGVIILCEMIKKRVNLEIKHQMLIHELSSPVSNAFSVTHSDKTVSALKARGLNDDTVDTAKTTMSTVKEFNLKTAIREYGIIYINLVLYGTYVYKC